MLPNVNIISIIIANFAALHTKGRMYIEFENSRVNIDFVEKIDEFPYSKDKNY